MMKEMLSRIARILNVAEPPPLKRALSGTVAADTDCRSVCEDFDYRGLPRENTAAETISDLRSLLADSVYSRELGGDVVARFDRLLSALLHDRFIRPYGIGTGESVTPFLDLSIGCGAAAVKLRSAVERGDDERAAINLACMAFYALLMQLATPSLSPNEETT
jgi:hypothetical protein